MTGKPYDFSHKVLIVGDSGVGKTCILLRFVDVTFDPNFVATIGKAEAFVLALLVGLLESGHVLE